MKNQIYPVKPISFKLGGAESSEIAQYLHAMYFKHRLEYLNKCKKIPGSSLVRSWNWYYKEVLLESIHRVSRSGRRIKKVYGIPLTKQFLDIIKMSLSLPARPQEYYIFDLFKQPNREVAREYIFRHEVKNVLYKMLINTPKIAKKSPLTNKGRFARKALRNGLAIAPTICTINKGKVKYYNEHSPQGDVFVKTLSGRGGKGADLWQYDQETNLFTHSKVKGKYKLEDVLELYSKKSKKESYIFQQKVSNHPDLSEIACNALSTCRIVTMLNENDQPEVVTAVLRMAARADSIVDNIHRGGIAAPIDIIDGRLGKATNLGVVDRVERLSNHPVSGAKIEGRELPFWPDAISAALHAHEVFRPRVIIGWDIAITAFGPVIIEGNAQPCVDLIQRPYDKPLGNSRFGELLAYHLRKLNFG
ncbi:MAG: hypothetical protein FH749_07525 [Firmicutes bacterium]|nr:hypothetical protein [Bacillota bacterium]